MLEIKQNERKIMETKMAFRMLLGLFPPHAPDTKSGDYSRRKILMFNNKLTHLSKRSTKEKLLSYLSKESIRQDSLSFSIPLDHQMLADYLCVERAALSVVISKLQKEGILSAEKNHFTLICN